jgi:hypothetical protein
MAGTQVREVSRSGPWLERAEQARSGGLFTGRNAARRGLEGNALRRLPHGSAADESRRFGKAEDVIPC